jgi:drug/metabolite transporter (DMT)-like permease
MEAKSDILKNEENFLLIKNYHNEKDIEEKSKINKISNNNSNNQKEIEINIEKEKENIKKIIIAQEYQNNENKSICNDYSTFNLTSNTNKLEKTENSIVINENTTNFDLYKGLIYMFLSCIFKSIFSILSKYALKDKKDLSSFQLLTFRTYYMMWISISVTYALPFSIFSQKFAKIEKILPVVIRTIFAIISMSLVIYSIKFIHISDVYSVYYIYPAFVIIFSVFFLKEKTSIFDICCLLACFLGAILIVKPEFIFETNSNEKHTNFYFILVILAAFLKAFEDVIIRNVGKEVNFLIFPFMYSLMGIIFFPIPMFIFDSVYPSLSLFDNFVIFLIGLCTFLYMSFMALGFQNENAGRVSMINYFQVALMYVSDICLFDKKLHFLDLLGTSLIFGFNFVNGLIKSFKRMAELEKVKLKHINLINKETKSSLEKKI